MKKRFFMGGRKRYKIYRKDLRASRFFSIDSFFVGRIYELMKKGIEFKAEDREKSEIYIFEKGVLRVFKDEEGVLREITSSFFLKNQAR